MMDLGPMDNLVHGPSPLTREAFDKAIAALEKACEPLTAAEVEQHRQEMVQREQWTRDALNRLDRKLSNDPTWPLWRAILSDQLMQGCSQPLPPWLDDELFGGGAGEGTNA